MGKIAEKDILQICNQFDLIDDSKCGKITVADLMYSDWLIRGSLFGTRKPGNFLGLALTISSRWNRIKCTEGKIKKVPDHHFFIYNSQLVPYPNRHSLQKKTAKLAMIMGAILRKIAIYYHLLVFSSSSGPRECTYICRVEKLQYLKIVENISL